MDAAGDAGAVQPDCRAGLDDLCHRTGAARVVWDYTSDPAIGRSACRLLVYHETLGAADGVGAALIGLAMVLVREPEQIKAPA